MHNKFKEYAIYQIYPRSFQDSNEDGFGDLEGVIQRLPYISKLGIDFIWLSPFFKSHQYDNGYDVDDYMSIDPRFGDFDTFDRLVKEAKKYNIYIMLDMVFNHTSTYHQWFQKALEGDPKYMDYYIFKDNKGQLPTNWESKFGGSAWKLVKDLDKYYLHLFHEKQADLNWKNPAVRNELVEVLKFWHQKGVRGFRFDVVNLICKPDIYEDDLIGDGRRFYTDGPLVISWLQEIFNKANIEDCVTVGELSSTTIENSIKYTNPQNGGLSMAFNFHHLKVDYKDGDKWSIGSMKWQAFLQLLDEWQSKVQEGNGWSAWFLNNHDQPRAISRFGNDEKYHYELGSALATLTHTLRGTPYIYQGEEIGMKNPRFNSIADYKDYESTNYYHILLERGYNESEALHTLAERSRDNARVPVRWDKSLYGGFSKVKPWISPSPDIDINYEDAINNPLSLFYHYKDLITLRKKHEAISYGDYEKIYIDDRLYAFERKTVNEKLIVMINFSEDAYYLNDSLKNNIKNGKIINLNYGNFQGDFLDKYQAVILEV